MLFLLRLELWHACCTYPPGKMERVHLLKIVHLSFIKLFDKKEQRTRSIVMKLNNLKRTLLASTFGLVGLLSATQVASAQIYREDRQDRREDRQERREDRRDAARDGYQEGLEEGREDARARRAYNPQAKSDYRRAGGED